MEHDGCGYRVPDGGWAESTTIIVDVGSRLVGKGIGCADGSTGGGEGYRNWLNLSIVTTLLYNA